MVMRNELNEERIIPILVEIWIIPGTDSPVVIGGANACKVVGGTSRSWKRQRDRVVREGTCFFSGVDGT